MGDEIVNLEQRMIYVREKIFGKRSKTHFAKALGIPLTTYIEYEKGREPPVGVIERICKLTHVSCHWLVTGEGRPWESDAMVPTATPARQPEGAQRDMREPARPVRLPVAPGGSLGGIPGKDFDELRPEQTASLPLMGSIVAGPPVQAEAWDRIQYARVLAHQGRPNRYVLRVQGNSMSPELKPEDLVLIENREDFDAREVLGRICAVMVNGEATLKRVSPPRRDQTGVIVELRSDNPETGSIQVREGDDFRILGVAIEVVSRML